MTLERLRAFRIEDMVDWANDISADEFGERFEVGPGRIYSSVEAVINDIDFAFGCVNHSLDAVRYGVSCYRAKWLAGAGQRFY